MSSQQEGLGLVSVVVLRRQHHVVDDQADHAAQQVRPLAPVLRGRRRLAKGEGEVRVRIEGPSVPDLEGGPDHAMVRERKHHEPVA